MKFYVKVIYYDDKSIDIIAPRECDSDVKDQYYACFDSDVEQRTFDTEALANEYVSRLMAQFNDKPNVIYF
jgi:hypothetical protein